MVDRIGVTTEAMAEVIDIEMITKINTRINTDVKKMATAVTDIIADEVEAAVDGVEAAVWILRCLFLCVNLFHHAFDHPIVESGPYFFGSEIDH